MRKVLFTIAVVAAAGLMQAAGEMRLHDSGIRMDWDRAVDYCRSLDAFVPSVDTMESAFRGSYSSQSGTLAYQRDQYWTSDELEIDGAYSFDFASGLHGVDHKSSKYRVMCIQSNP